MYLGSINDIKIYRSNLGGGSLLGLHDVYNKIIRIGDHLHDTYKEFEVLVHELIHKYKHDEYETRILARNRIIESGHNPVFH